MPNNIIFDKTVEREKADRVYTKMLGGQTRNARVLQALTHEYESE